MANICNLDSMACTCLDGIQAGSLTRAGQPKIYQQRNARGSPKNRHLRYEHLPEQAQTKKTTSNVAAS